MSVFSSIGSRTSVSRRAGIWVSGLLAALIVTGCRREPAANVFVDPALATLVPGDTVFVAGARVEQLRQTPFYRQYLAPGKIAAVERFARESGVEIRKNLWEVLIPYNGRDWFVMLRGRFAEMGMEPRIQREGARRLGYKGYTILGDERMAVLFLNPTTAVAGPLAALQRLLDFRDRSGGMPTALAAKLRSVASSNQVFFAGDASVLRSVSLVDLPAGIVAGGVDLREGLSARITAETASNAHAERLRQAVRAWLGTARLNTPENGRELLRVYDGIRVESDRARVDLHVDLPVDLLDELLRLLLPAR